MFAGSGSTAGGRHHLHSTENRVRLLGGDPRPIFPQGGGLVAGADPGQLLGRGRIARGDRKAKTSARTRPSFRSGCAICQRGICGSSGKAGDDCKYEPSGKSVRQCKLRKLYEDFETGGNLCKPVPRLRTPAHPYRRIHRKLLQSAALALCVGLPFSRRI